MKILFVHDHRFLHFNGTYYTRGALPQSIWGRFLVSFKKVTVVGRDGGEINKEKASKLAISSRKGVNFQLLPSASNLPSLLGFGPARKRIENLVAQHDAIVARLGSSLGLIALHAAKNKENRLQ